MMHYSHMARQTTHYSHMARQMMHTPTWPDR